MAASTAVSREDTSPAAPSSERTVQVASLTGLRGFAALMVVVIHVTGRTSFPWLGLQGYGPVSLFVLSGYLLFRPWSRWGAGTAERPSVRVFARRRLLRIFPAYLVVLAVVVAVYAPARPDGVDGWLRAVTLTGIYASDGLRPALEQTWSLGTELSWYVVLPVVGLVTALVARRWPGRRGFALSTGLILLAVPLSAWWRWWVQFRDLDVHFTYAFWFPGYAFCFAAGALVAHLVEGDRAGVVSVARLRRLASDPWILLLVAVAVALVGSSSLGGPDGYATLTFTERQVRSVSVTLVAVILLVVAVLGGARSPVNRLLGTRVFNAIGRWSFGIYLWHLPVVVILESELTFPGGAAGLLWRLAVVLGISVPLAAATFAWVEQPAIAWSHGRGRVLDRRRTSAPSAAPATSSSQAAAPTATPGTRPPAE